MDDLKTIRLARGMRLIDVAQAANVAVSLISMAEHGYRPGARSQQAISAAVGASPGSFWPQAAQG